MKLLLQIVAGIGLALLAAALLTYLQSVNFVNQAKLTTGTVVGMFASSDPDTNSRFYCPQITFTTKTGQIIKFESNICSAPAPYAVGELVNLYYDPQNPQNAQIKSFSAQYLMPTSLMLSGLPLTLIGLLGLFLQKKRDRAQQQNTPL